MNIEFVVGQSEECLFILRKEIRDLSNSDIFLVHSETSRSNIMFLLMSCVILHMCSFIAAL